MKIVALAGVALALTLSSEALAAQPGALTQPAGVAGCVSQTGGTCAQGHGLGGATAVAVSPDGRNVYVVSQGTQALAAFTRDAGSGALTELGCFTLWVNGDPQCAKLAAGLSAPVAVTVSEDGRSVYVANTMHEVTVFQRDLQTGGLSQPAGQPCVGSWGSAGCPGGSSALAGAADVVTIGDDVYVAATVDQAIGELKRDPSTSVLTQPAGRPACISRDTTASSTTGKGANCTLADLRFKQPFALAATPAADELLAVDLGGRALWSFPRDTVTGVLSQPWCESSVAGLCGAAVIHGMQMPRDVAIGPGGRHVYVTSNAPGGVAVLQRSPIGNLTQPATGARYSCVTNDGGDGCVQGRALSGAEGLVIAPDGRDVYVAAVSSGAVDTFARDAQTGDLHQLDGVDGCLSYDGAGGVCAAGRLLEGVHSLAISPDGRNLYAASSNHGAVLVFDREPLPVATEEAPRETPGVATEPGTVPATPTAPPTVSLTAAPRLTGFAASPRRFRPTSSTRLRLTLSAPATVRITLTRRGRRRALRTLTARPGTRALRLSGRRLKPGRYVARAVVAGSDLPGRMVNLVIVARVTHGRDHAQEKGR